MSPGLAALGTFMSQGLPALRKRRFRGQPALGTFMSQGLTALGTFLSPGLPALGTFMSLGLPALGKFMSRGAASPVHTGQYIQRGNLLTHIKSLHKGIKLPCGQCDYKTNKKCRLQRQGRLPYVLFACHSKLPALLDINVPRAGSPDGNKCT